VNSRRTLADPTSNDRSPRQEDTIVTAAYNAPAVIDSSTIHGTRIELQVGHIPTPTEGLGPCSECPEHGSIADGQVLLGYRSPALSGIGETRVSDVVCLTCLPALTAMLQDSGVDQVTVEIPTPCFDMNTPTVSRLHHERDVLIRRLVVERVWANVIFWQQRFACTQQMLWRIARGDFAPFAGVSMFIPDTEPW
jgi:hypothetical protein